MSIIRDEKAFYYRENFCHNEHLNLVGYSRVWGPLILSVMKEAEKFKMILRSVSGTETREILFDVYNQDEGTEWTQAVFGSLAQDTFSQVKSKFSIQQSYLNKNVKQYFRSSVWTHGAD